MSKSHRQRNAAKCAKFELRVTQRLKELIPAGTRILVAVSGGPDSIALAEVLGRAWYFSKESTGRSHSIEPVLAYVDHRLRGRSASRRERRCVTELGRRWGLRVETADLETELQVSVPEGTEAAARHARYREFARIAGLCGCHDIALAHHMNDQAETFLMRLISGARIEGLSAMRPITRRDGLNVVRPLLTIEKEEIERYVRMRRLRVTRDRTNRNTHYLRARVRRHIIPVLNAVRPNALASINRSIEALAEAEAVIERVAGAAPRFDDESRNPLEFADAGQREGEEYAIDRSAFENLLTEVRLRKLHEALAALSLTRDYRVPRSFFSPLLGTTIRTGVVLRGYGVEFRVDRDRLLARRLPEDRNRLPMEIIHETSSVSSLSHMPHCLPEPFSMLSARILDTERRHAASALAEDIVSEPFSIVSGKQIAVPALLPLSVRRPEPDDAGYFCMSRAGFKRRISGSAKRFLVIADAETVCLLLERDRAGVISGEYSAELIGRAHNFSRYTPIIVAHESPIAEK